MECNNTDGIHSQNIELLTKSPSMKYIVMMRKCQKLEEENRKLRAQLEVLESKPHDPLQKSSGKLCEICLSSMSEHEFGQHLCPNQVNIACEYCTDATFTSILGLREHLSNASHSNVTFYQCGKCTLAFPMRELLEIHEKTNETHSNVEINGLGAPPMFECKY